MPHLYVVKPRFRDGPVKIGITGDDLAKRLSQLQTSHYEELEIVCVVPSDDARALERTIHRMFREYRIRGEWFASHPSLIAYVMSLHGVFSPLGAWVQAKAGSTWRYRKTDALPDRAWH